MLATPAGRPLAEPPGPGESVDAGPPGQHQGRWAGTDHVAALPSYEAMGVSPVHRQIKRTGPPVDGGALCEDLPTFEQKNYKMCV